LRAESITFRRAVCPAPVCVPSRTAVFSGLSPERTGCYLNGKNPWEEVAQLKGIESMPECFRRSGYLTWGRGKLTHAPLGPTHDAWEIQGPGGNFGPFPPEDEQYSGNFWGVSEWTKPDTEFPDVRNANAAIDFLKQDHDRPFFMVLGLWRPHTPFTAPKRFFDAIDPATIPLPTPGFRADDLDDVPAGGRELAAVYGPRWEADGASNPEHWRRLLHGYLACTAFADDSLGRVVDALDTSAHAEDTIVIFWSDNGFHVGEKSHFGKYTLWELSANTPIVIRLPGKAHAGTTCGAPVSAQDLYPTLIARCGLEKPEHVLSGHSFSGLMENPDAPWPHAGRTFYGEGLVTLRSGTHRYIRYPDGAEELYDSGRDPHEFHNLAEDPARKDVLETFRKELPERYAPSIGGRRG
ncbi:MAG: sulfatase, partial [Verrucomicrobiae bacterium]|nr:sulfatase [Verrucomicrobiae bacterium]